ncbi:O-antigen ligase family protein [Planococcus sp. CP5-4]|uniref:O-antigen ligase family protein n=1 Tax=unclassified Planococcus (in: firmicutes) TaxID=2662419 RepID=UPI001C2441C7|nr:MULTISPECIES: O-antigen ligase family protein [unclassified Planococcus (in: firmicutes)]MBU9675170.1 O-antigen ligase family protein [Planococcus sp. CP5-4_YE]MBV0908049.1 O-antigen ligase family protein [Planococcus sp. CP5-4_UN]MBW6062110.1 O-antigen ligase family protein [Planococcus sp. CP5-4]
MLKYLFLLGIMGEWVFFLFLSLFRLEYAGAQNSNLYTYFWILIFSATTIALIVYLLNYIKKGTFPKFFILKVSPIIFVILLYLISFLLNGFDNNANGYYASIFFAMCIPAYLIGLICTSLSKENQLINIVVNFVLLGSIILILSLVRLITGGGANDSLDTIGGVGRLGIGYLATHFFIVTFYLFLFSNKLSDVFKSTLKPNNRWLWFIYLLLAIQLATVIFSGSRGPLLNLVIISIVMVITKVFQKNIIESIKKIAVLIILAFSFFLLYNIFGSNYFSTSTERTLTLFQLNESNWAGGSGRESIYPLALKMFEEKPIFGYGPLGFLSESNLQMHPHNLILEGLVDYGIVGAVFIVIFLFYILKRYSNAIKSNVNILLIFFLFISTLLELQVSGTFMAHARFWFFIGLSIGFTNRKDNKIERV